MPSSPSSDLYHWIEFSLPSPVEMAERELLVWRIVEEGAPAVEEIDNPDGTVTLRVSHSDPALIDRIAALAPGRLSDRGSDPNRDWDLWWREQQHPIEVTPRLRVLPPWVSAEPLPGVLDFTIEAKMAFGTGHHETTRLAALLMERHLDDAPLPNRRPGHTPPAPRRLLDIGTGTGILAMYARHLGTDPVGTEIDPVTAECLAENWRNNGLGEPRAILAPLSALRTDPPFQVIVANMIRNEVWPLREEIVERLAPGGLFIISGQLTAEKEIVLDWFATAGFRLIGQADEGEWWSGAALLLPEP